MDPLSAVSIRTGSVDYLFLVSVSGEQKKKTNESENNPFSELRFSVKLHWLMEEWKEETRRWGGMASAGLLPCVSLSESLTSEWDPIPTSAFVISLSIDLPICLLTIFSGLNPLICMAYASLLC